MSSVSTARPLGGKSLKLVDTGEQGNTATPTEHTFLAFCGSSSEYTLICLTRTFESLKVPSRAWPMTAGSPMFRRESGSTQDCGKIPWAPHISLSSCRNSWNAWLVGSETPARTYTSIEYRSSLKCLGDSRYPGTQRAVPNHRLSSLG